METYRVQRAFTYNGTAYQVGMDWQPAGHRVDNLLIKQRRVVPIATDESTTETETDAPARVARGKRHARV
jgi:hypothetical protein